MKILLLTKFLLYLQDNGVTFYDRRKKIRLLPKEIFKLRDSFVEQDQNKKT